MRPDPNTPYYAAYEKRYRAIYEQGIEYWASSPDELAAIERDVNALISWAGLSAEENSIVTEFGCGEGFVAKLVGELGLHYAGADLAPSAVSKARSRLTEHRECLTLVSDCTRTPFRSEVVDASIDIGCLHMLVVDRDRKAYLNELARILKPGGVALFREAYRDDAIDLKVNSYESWLQAANVDVDTPQPRKAWSRETEVELHLPCIAARSRNFDQYQKEFSNSGFQIARHRIAEDRNSITLFVGKEFGQTGASV